MNSEEKKQFTLLGIRAVLLFLTGFGLMVFAAYYVLSQNFQKLFKDYSLKLLQSMVNQGVTTVEYELRVSREEAETLAGSLTVPAEGGQKVVFPSITCQPDILRMIYVTGDGTAVSDGRQRSIRTRPDILEAFEGKTAVYGPYFNDEKEYLICYSAPVIRDGRVVGVLSVEKDGYYFCSLIKEIRFIDSGESYIINAEGTDIAVSNQEHIEWVNEQYNAQRILEEQEDSAARSIMELEKKGLSGESGLGVYEWGDGLYYLVYAPIPSTQWVLLASLRQEEIAAMTHSALFDSIAEGPVLGIGILIFFLLIAVIAFWVISSLKKSTEMNKKLKMMASYDPLTGTLNRNSYHEALKALSDGSFRSLTCIYIDVNGLHELNNHLGHQAGDRMLKTVADALRRVFKQGEVYRIGGDEFVVFCQNQNKLDAVQKTEIVRKELKKQEYEISAGIEWRDRDLNVKAMVSAAEEMMQKNKELYYRKNGRERQLRSLNKELEQMVVEKDDADTFLSVLAPDYKGVYFVDLGSDMIRHLYIPPYFEEMLNKSDNIFSKALSLYAQSVVSPDYRRRFEEFCDYEKVEVQLNKTAMMELIYQKTDGTWLQLRILKFKTYTKQCRETLWIFSYTDPEIQMRKVSK